MAVATRQDIDSAVVEDLTDGMMDLLALYDSKGICQIVVKAQIKKFFRNSVRYGGNISDYRIEKNNREKPEGDLKHS